MFKNEAQSINQSIDLLRHKSSPGSYEGKLFTRCAPGVHQDSCSPGVNQVCTRCAVLHYQIAEMFSRLKNLGTKGHWKRIVRDNPSCFRATYQSYCPKQTVLTERHNFYWLRQKDGEETGVFFLKVA